MSKMSRRSLDALTQLLIRIVISEICKGDKANPGVRAFFADTSRDPIDLYLSVVSIRELRQGVERIGNDGMTRRQSVSAAGSNR